MNNNELDRLLKQASQPEPPAGLTRNLPGRVTARLRHGSSSQSLEMPFRRHAWVWGLATACVILGAFVVGFWRGQQSAFDPGQLADARRYLHETQALFPNQVKAIIFDKNGPHLVLSEKPDVGASLPVFMTVSNAQTAESIITYSGQQINIHGEPYDVLLNGNNEVFLVGKTRVWSKNSRSGWGKTEITAHSMAL